MYGVMRLSQSPKLCPCAALATVWRSPQPNRLSSVLSRRRKKSAATGVRFMQTEAAFRCVDSASVAGALSAQASTANGIYRPWIMAEFRLAVSDGVAATRKAFGPDRAEPLRVDRLGHRAGLLQEPSGPKASTS